MSKGNITTPLVILRLKVGDPKLIERWAEQDYWHIAAAGPSIARRGFMGNVSLLDLAPTWLSLLREPSQPQYDGLKD